MSRGAFALVVAAPGAMTFAVFAVIVSATVFRFAGDAARFLTVPGTRGDVSVTGVDSGRFGRFFAVTVTGAVLFALAMALPLLALTPALLTLLPPTLAFPLSTVIRPGEGDRGAKQRQRAADRQRGESRE